ncbi:MAG: WYL domain-containing transcriptional regulator [Treponema sp.]|nr:WYL domain-containing transcriptional regulator [Treponema sp.]
MNKAREDKVRTYRIFQIADYIKNHNYPNVPALMKAFECSRSTIMRDLDFLKDRYNMPIEYDEDKRGYYYTDPTFVVKSVMLSEGELLTVSTLLPLMEQYKNTPLESTFKSIMTKMIEMMPNKVEVDSAFSAQNVQFIKDHLPKIDEEIFNNVFKAIRANKTIEFAYRSISKQDYSYRFFDPYKVLCQKGNWYIIGWCHSHKDFIVYSLSRMKDLKITGESFQIKQDFDLNKHIDPEFGIWQNEQEAKKIELLFSKDINTYILERTWHVNQECRQNDDGSVYLSYMTNQMQETFYWILSLGSKVKVLNPPELIERIKKETSLLAELYKD